MKTLMIFILGYATVATAQYPFPPHPVELKPILEVQGVDSNEALGADTKGVGDLNKDGYADVAVSAPGYHQTFIYFGGKTMSDTPSVVLKGGGQIVSGDFKGNGWTDLAIEDFNTNTVLVYYNGPNGLDTIPDLTLTSTPTGDYFGPIMTTGDFFGNGYTDLAVASVYGKWADKSLDMRGRIFVFAGGPGGLNPTAVDTIVGDSAYVWLGTDLVAGDIYNDGKDALVALGFNEVGITPQTQYSYISVFSADSSRHLRRTLYIDSQHVPGGFGGPDGDGSVACFDADGDGIADILVSGIDIFKGGTTIDTLPTYFVPPPNGDTADFGPLPWVGGGGDYNGDGIPDMLVTSERSGPFGEIFGIIVMVDRRNHPGQYMGYRIYSVDGISLEGTPQTAGDVNGDGLDDIIIGSGGYFYPKYYGFFGIYSGDTAMVTPVVERKPVPEGFKLNQNYPNPFNPSTTISYQLSSASNVTLKIYDALGREVKTLINDDRESPGSHTVVWNGTNDEGQRVSSGIYFYRISTNDGTLTRKAVYLK